MLSFHPCHFKKKKKKKSILCILSHSDLPSKAAYCCYFTQHCFLQFYDGMLMCWVTQGYYQYSFRLYHSCWHKNHIFLTQRYEQNVSGGGNSIPASWKTIQRREMFFIPYGSSLLASPIADRDLDLQKERNSLWFQLLNVCR